MNDAEVRTVLVLAREKIQHGWVQGTARTGHKVCAAQAIAESIDATIDLGSIPAHHTSDFQRVSDYVLRIINQKSGWHYAAIPPWNDEGNRTKRDVLAVFDEAIRLLDKVEVVEPPTVTVEAREFVPVFVEKKVIPIEAITEVQVEKSWVSKVKDLVGV